MIISCVFNFDADANSDPDPGSAIEKNVFYAKELCLDPDPWIRIFFRIRIQEAKMLRSGF